MAKKKRKSNLIRNLVIIVVLLIVALFIGRSMGVFGKKDLEKVVTSKVKKVNIVEKVTASGKVQPEAEVKISPDVSGEIVDVFVEEGDSVVKGQLLLKIRPDNFQDAVAIAQASLSSTRSNFSQSQSVLMQRRAELNRAKAEFDRNKKLYDQRVISETDFLSAKTNYEVAQQTVQAAQEQVDAARYNIQSSQASLDQNLDNLSRTEIYAPVNGTVSKLSVEKGEKVVGTAQMAGTEMLIIANLDNMEVQVDVNENDIVKVRQGQEVEIDVDAYTSTGRKFTGVVTEIANTANETLTADAVTEFQVKIRILPSSYQDLKRKNYSPFRPGMTASVDIITNKKEGVVSVPIVAVTTRRPDELKVRKEGEGKPNAKKQKGGEKETTSKEEEEAKEVVFVLDTKTQEVKAMEVETGISDFDNIEIIKGLKVNQEVVTGPFNLIAKRLKNGQKVEKGTGLNER